MKIWIDLTNSPHVNFFARMITELSKENEVILTCRPLANTIELLDLLKLPYHVIGRHYGRKSYKKITGFLVRIVQLFLFVRRKDIDVAISHSSFYSPVVAKMIGCRCIYLNDNEHAEGNRISFICANSIMVPEFLKNSNLTKQWANLKKVIRYPGVKEGVYLWFYQESNDQKWLSKIASDKKVIFVRPEPWTAQYYRGKRYFFDRLLTSLNEKYAIVLLPRGEEQKKYYAQEKFKGIIVPEKSISLEMIMNRCDFFIGAGGTMTREAAVLGIPTISIYQDALLDVDTYLIENGHMLHHKDPNASFVEEFIGSNIKQSPDKRLLVKGQEAYALIKNVILNHNYEKEKDAC